MAPPSLVPWHHFSHVLSPLPPCFSSPQVLIEGMRRVGAVLRRQHATLEALTHAKHAAEAQARAERAEQHAAATEAAAQAAAAARAAAEAEAEAARQRAATAAAHARA